MPEIIPAIIAQDKAELAHKLSLVEGLVSWAQIDVMDGTFVDPTTWRTPEDLNDIHAAIHLEAHLMISKPEETIDQWLASPVRRVLLHYESTTHAQIKELIAKIKSAGKEAGIALKLQTPLFVLDELVSQVSVIQLMGIAEIGYYGHGFEVQVLDRVKALRDKYPDVTIEVDGGVTLENASALIQAGCHNLVVGSAIFNKGDVKEAIKKFNAALA